MKKLFFIQVFVLVCIAGFGQLKVANNGKVGVGANASSPLSGLAINGNGNINTGFYLFHPGGGSGPRYGLQVEATAGPVTSYGIYATCAKNYSVGMPGSSCGIMGIAGGCGSSQNRGVVGKLNYSTGYNPGGAGIVGITATSLNTDIAYGGHYAGYFHGDVKVTGTIEGTLVSGSDIRYKKNIVELESKQALNNVLKLNPIEYNLEQQYQESEKEKIALLDKESQHFQKKHYGLIAQELKEIYPDLVYEQENGYLAVNYVELIPILIQSMKEMKQETDVLNERIKVLEGSKSSFRNAETDNNISSENQTAILYQNTPNPFTQSTEIKYYLPQSVHIAYLCIYDLQGKLLKQINIAQRGEGIETISATEFPAGIYLYGLIADGKEVDMKRMILTK